MDTVSHGLWSFIIWHALPFPLLAVLFGMLPDLISMGPMFVYNLWTRRHKETGLNEEGLPLKLQRYKRISFLYTHSLVVAGTVVGIVTLVWGFQWWILAWPFHICIDIITHPREKATPFLWPLVGTRVHGLKWWSRQFLVLNGALLIVAYIKYVR
jgi:hypothetical protein